MSVAIVNNVLDLCQQWAYRKFIYPSVCDVGD